MNAAFILIMSPDFPLEEIKELIVKEKLTKHREK